VPLDPKAKELLDEVAASGRPNAHLLPVAEARANFEDLFASLGPGEEVAEVLPLEIPVTGGPIAARLYRPAAEGPLPVVAYYHGGGWLLGSVAAYDIVCRALANAAGAMVLSVGYRLAPEHKYPTAVEDAYAAARWLAENAAALGGDRHRVAVAGDSAGGNLAAVVALQARDLTRPRLGFQLLVYPVTTCDLELGYDMAYEGYFLYRDELQWHQDHYLPSPELRHEWRVSPLDAADHSGLPPAFVITAECDPLHRQGELYAERLRAAGVAVEQREYPGMIHGFFGLDMVFDQAADAMRDAGAAIRQAFEG
jgi:acetyl esterase/lipase